MKQPKKENILLPLTNEQLKSEWRYWQEELYKSERIGEVNREAREMRSDCVKELISRGLQIPYVP